MAEKSFAERYPYRDAEGNLLVAKGICDTEKKLIVPDGTVEIAINEGAVYCLLQDKSFQKLALATGEIIPFSQKKYKVGSATIDELFNNSQKIVGPIKSWEISGGKIYALVNFSKIFLLNAKSCEREQVLFFKEDIIGIGVEKSNIYIASTATTISCYSLLESRLLLQWGWINQMIQNFEPKKITIRNGILYAISDDKLFRMEFGKVKKNKEVGNVSIISTSKCKEKIIDFVVSEDGRSIITLDIQGNIEVFDEYLNKKNSRFKIESAQAIEMECNCLYILIDQDVRIFEFLDQKK